MFLFSQYFGSVCEPFSREHILHSLHIFLLLLSINCNNVLTSRRHFPYFSNEATSWRQTMTLHWRTSLALSPEGILVLSLFIHSLSWIRRLGLMSLDVPLFFPSVAFPSHQHTPLCHTLCTWVHMWRPSVHIDVAPVCVLQVLQSVLRACLGRGMSLAMNQCICQAWISSVGCHWFFFDYLLHPIWLMQDAHVLVQDHAHVW